MAEQRHEQITATATQARQGERGPTVLSMLAASTIAAIVVLAVVWFVFFKT